MRNAYRVLFRISEWRKPVVRSRYKWEVCFVCYLGTQAFTKII